MTRGWRTEPEGHELRGERLARIVRTIGLGVLVALLPAALHNGAQGRWASVLALASEAVLVLTSLHLSRRGAHRAASLVLSASVVLLATVLQITGHRGVHDVATLIYPAAIVVAGALLDHRTFVAATAFSMVALAVLYALELSGIVAYPMTPFVEARYLLDAEVVLALTALTVALLLGDLRGNAARALTALTSLRESEARYRTLFDAINEAVFVHDPADGAILDANAMATTLFGYSAAELRLLSVADITAPDADHPQETALAHLRAAARGETQRFEWRARDRAGRVFWSEIVIRSAVIHGELRLLVSVRDIDDRKRADDARQRLEDQLRQAQRLESVGRLAGGVAHDFNNLLTCIVGNLDLSADAVEDRPEVAASMDEIRHAALRAAELTGQLLAFSRKQPIAPRPLDVPELLGRTRKLLARLLGENIALATSVAPDLPRIHADPGQVEQMLMNLAVNARDAMPDGGRLTLAADVATFDAAYCDRHPEASPGDFVRLLVADTGTGLSEEARAHLFEPFFTTKPRGRGTGLGLAMVFGAMQQNGGFVQVASIPGAGATFTLCFPAVRDAAAPRATEATAPALPTGHERVLLVEDDDGVRRLGAALLERLGYRVTACAHGEAALAAAPVGSEPFALLLTDVVLPGLDGRAVAEALVARHPGLRVLYSSGYTDDVIGHRGVLDEGVAFLPKPFSAEQLATAVRAALDAPIGGSARAGNLAHGVL